MKTPVLKSVFQQTSGGCVWLHFNIVVAKICSFKFDEILLSL